MRSLKRIYKISIIITLSIFLEGCSMNKASITSESNTEICPTDAISINSNDNIDTEIIGKSIDKQELRLQPDDALKYVLDGNVILLSDGSKFDINGDGKFETIHITQWREDDKRIEGDIETDKTWDLYYDIGVDDSMTVIAGPDKERYIGVVSLDGEEIQLLIYRRGNFAGEVIGDIGIFEYEEENIVYKDLLNCDLNKFILEDGEYKGSEYIYGTVFGNIDFETINKYDGKKIIRYFSEWNDLTGFSPLTLLFDLQLREEKDSDTETIVIKRGSKVQPIGIEPIDRTELGTNYDVASSPFHYWLCLQDVESGVEGWVYCEYTKVYQNNNSQLIDEQLFENLNPNVG